MQEQTSIRKPVSTKNKVQTQGENLTAQFNQLKSKLTRVNQKEERIELLLTISDLAKRLYFHKEALYYLTEIIKIDRLNAPALEKKLDLFIFLKEWNQAFNVFRFIQNVLIPIGRWQITESFYNKWFIIGNFLFKEQLNNGEWKKASEYITLLLNIFDRLKTQHERHDIKHIDLSKIELDLGELYFNLGVCEYHLGQHERANYFFQKIPNDSPFNSSKEVYLVEIFRKPHKWHRIITQLKHNLTMASSQKVRTQIWCKIADIYASHLNLPKEASLYLEKLLSASNIPPETLKQARELSIKILSSPSVGTDLADFFTLYIDHEENNLLSKGKEERYKNYIKMAHLAKSRFSDPVLATKFFLKALNEEPSDIQILSEIHIIVTGCHFSNLNNQETQMNETTIHNMTRTTIRKIQQKESYHGFMLYLEWIKLNQYHLQREHINTIRELQKATKLDKELSQKILDVIQNNHHLPGVSEIYPSIIEVMPTRTASYRELAEIYKLKHDNTRAAYCYHALSLFTELEASEVLFTKQYFKTPFGREKSHSPTLLRNQIKINLARNPFIKFMDNHFAIIERTFSSKNTFPNLMNTNTTRAIQFSTPIESSFIKLLNNQSFRSDDRCKFFLKPNQIDNIRGINLNNSTEIYIWQPFWQNLSEKQQEYLILREIIKVRFHYYFIDNLTPKVAESMLAILSAIRLDTMYDGDFKREYEALAHHINANERIVTPSNEDPDESFSQAHAHNLKEILNIIDMIADRIAFIYVQSFETAISYIAGIHADFYQDGNQFKPTLFDNPDYRRRIGNIIKMYVSKKLIPV